jgi:hypothetical protein
MGFGLDYALLGVLMIPWSSFNFSIEMKLYGTKKGLESKDGRFFG